MSILSPHRAGQHQDDEDGDQDGDTGVDAQEALQELDAAEAHQLIFDGHGSVSNDGDQAADCEHHSQGSDPGVDAQLGDHVAQQRAGDDAGQQAGCDAQDGVDLANDTHDNAGEGVDGAGGQVDLAQQDDEGHAECQHTAVLGGLEQDVDDVVGGQEVLISKSNACHDHQNQKCQDITLTLN